MRKISIFLRFGVNALKVLGKISYKMVIFSRTIDCAFLNVLYRRQSSKKPMVVDLEVILGETKLLLSSMQISIGQIWFEMFQEMWSIVELVILLRLIHRILVYTHHFPFPMPHGKM